MLFIYNVLFITFNLLISISVIELSSPKYDTFTTNPITGSLTDLKINQTNESEDLLILSSWKTLKYWTSNSRPHSSKVIENFDVFHSNISKNGKISGIEFFTDETNCENTVFWCELNTQTIYSSLIDIKNQSLRFTQSIKLVEMKYGTLTHIRLAMDLNNKNIYLSLFDFSRIDVFDIENKSMNTFLTNISKPVDIAIDNNQRIVFWIENWSCICQTYINNISIVRMCPNNIRALAVDSLRGELFYSDSLGRIYQRKYFQKNAQMVFEAKKMRQNYILHVTTGAIYLSDTFKLTAINRSTLSQKVVLIESPGILAFNSISKKDLCQRFERDEHNPNIKYNLTFEPKVINQSLILNLKQRSDSIRSNWFGSFNLVYIIILSILIILSLILLIFMVFKRFYRKNNLNRLQIKRIRGRKSKRFLFNDKNKLLTNSKDVNKTVCIEDLGSFSNNGYLDPKVFCTNCPIRTCSSCDDKEECLERGICLTTYKLLT